MLEVELKDRVNAFRQMRDVAKKLRQMETPLSAIEGIAVNQIEQAAFDALRDLKERLGDLYLKQI